MHVSHRAVAEHIAQQLRDGESLDVTLALTGILHALLALSPVQIQFPDRDDDGEDDLDAPTPGSARS